MTDPLAWLDAKSSCQGLGPGYNLASVHSDKENALLASMLYQDTKNFDKAGHLFLSITPIADPQGIPKFLLHAIKTWEI